MESSKKYLNKEWLEKEYDKVNSVSKIAKECGVALTTISRWLEHFDIRVRNSYTGNKKGQNNPYWRGGRYIDRTNGYVLVHKPDHPFARKKGYVFEHRLVVEKAIGRYLREIEIVHHRNKVKTDNRVENLELIVLGEVNGGDVICPHCSRVFKLS